MQFSNATNADIVDDFKTLKSDVATVGLIRDLFDKANRTQYCALDASIFF
jgi:hypothetical protein